MGLPDSRPLEPRRVTREFRDSHEPTPHYPAVLQDDGTGAEAGRRGGHGVGEVDVTFHESADDEWLQLGFLHRMSLARKEKGVFFSMAYDLASGEIRGHLLTRA